MSGNLSIGGVLASILALSPVIGAQPTPEEIKTDEATLTAAKLDTSGPALLDVIRKLTPSDAMRDRVRSLVVKLGDDDFQVREQAETALIAEGPVALGLLIASQRDQKDPEIKRRVANCVTVLEEKVLSPHVLAAVVRLVAVRKPDGAVECLLTGVPYLGTDIVTDEVEATLAALAVRAGKPHPALVAALASPEPINRGIAATALCRTIKEQRPAVAKLLGDKDAGVRLKAALALTEAGERTAVPVLIDLLGELPPERAWRIEETLTYLAGERSPSQPLGQEAMGRAKCRDAWEAWWKKHGADANLAVLSGTRQTLGFTLAVIVEGNTCTLTELGPDDKVRWRIPGLNNSVDATVLPGDRLLIAEYGSGRVTERNFKGEILWQHTYGNPINCQRLRDGNTWFATQNEIVEVDKSGKVISKANHPGLSAARKFADGSVAMVIGNNTYKLLDATGKVVKTFPVEVNIANSIGGVEFLPGGRVLVGQQGKVAEYGPDGKIVWQVNVPNSGNLYRLPNGHTLIGGLASNLIHEIDQTGKVVRQIDMKVPLWQVKRR